MKGAIYMHIPPELSSFQTRHQSLPNVMLRQ
jgi:hypothetical protein